MCDPMTIAGAALSAAGSFAGARQQQQYVDETNRQNNIAYEMSKKAREQELLRQAGMQNDAAARWNETLAALAPASRAETQDAATAEFLDTYDQRGAATDGQLLSGQDQADSAVATTIAGKIADTARETRARVANLAKLASYGAADTKNNLALSNSADFLGTLNGIRQGSLGVSQQEQSISPAQVTPGSSAFADILTGLGGLVASGAGSFGGTPAATPPLPRPNPLRITSAPLAPLY